MKLPSFSVIIICLCLFGLGLLMIPKLPVKLNPSRRLPEVHVTFSFPGQSARAVETEVTSKLEGMLSRIKGIREMSSYSSNGWGSITVRLSGHVNPDMARFEVSTIIRQARASLPDGVSYPHISMSGNEEEDKYPFLRYTVNAPFSPIQIQDYINDNLKPKIAEVQGIDRVDVTGAGRMVYKLEYDYEGLQNFHVSAGDIRSAVQSYLSREFLGLGKISEENSGEQWIRISLVPENSGRAFDPSQIQVRNSAGTILYLNQLVKTVYEEEEATSYFRINGLNSIYISITAEDAANQLALSRQIQDLVENYRQTLPQSYELHLTYDAGEYIAAEMNKIYFRSGLTILILLAFIFLIYRNLKYSLLILFSLISTLSISALFFYLFKIEMQMFSLAGLTISLSLIIDNAIVMSDQIIRRGNRKAFLAILTATLTSVGALSIILFMDENIRKNLQDFAGVIIITLSVSLFVAWFLIPALIDKMQVVKKQGKIPGKRRATDSGTNRLRRKLSGMCYKIRGKRRLVYFDRLYERMIFFMQRRKGWFIALVILAFGLPVFLLPEKIEPEVKKGYFVNETTGDLGYWAKLYNQTLGSAFYKEHLKPVIDPALGGTMRLFAQKVSNGSYASGERSETTLNIAATLPNGATREQMDFLIQKMENYIKQYPEVKQFETYIESGRRASIRILFVKQHQRSNFPYMLKSKLISKALELGGGAWNVYGLGDAFNNELKEQAGSSRIKLLGYNYDELNALAKAMQDSLLQHRRIKEVIIDSKFSWYKNDYMEYAFDLHKEELVKSAILPVDLFNSTRPMYEKNVNAGDWLHEGRIEPVRLFSRQASTLDIWNMEHYPGRSGEREYRLTDIARIEKRIEPQDIAKENQQYRLCLQYEYIGAYQQAWKVMERMIDFFNQTSPLGYKAESESYRYWWGENAASQYWLLFLIIAIIFFMSGFLFNSTTQPLVVIFIIPVSFIGLFLTFYLFKLNFDQGGFAAFILLAALSVNANIYVLNEYNNIRKANPRITASKAYIKAWNVKVKPIFLTIASTVLGFIPFMVGEYREAFWFPLAAGTVGGLVFSFIALFFFLPLFMGVGKGLTHNNI
ncbi:MAG: efflux RND transporter permease subunit [Dysgonamonadaceae bacterium]|jgi:multidrug efflux pump subunit AcrB|nr:efflux RND transporter permease subunit [Dysgonamonadaceae bacterium]